MPTREFEELVNEISATIEQYVVPFDPMHQPDPQPMNAAWPAHDYVVDYEKIVWHFPDASSRLIEDIA